MYYNFHPKWKITCLSQESLSPLGRRFESEFWLDWSSSFCNIMFFLPRIISLVSLFIFSFSIYHSLLFLSSYLWVWSHLSFSLPSFLPLNFEWLLSLSLPPSLHQIFSQVFSLSLILKNKSLTIFDKILALSFAPNFSLQNF